MLQELLPQMIEKMNASLEKVEKSAFDAINQQDIVYKLVSETAMEVERLMTKLDVISINLSHFLTMVKGKAQHEECKEIEGLAVILEEQEGVIAQLCQMVQVVMEQEALESELIHSMEEQVVNQREVLDAVEATMKIYDDASCHLV